MRKTMYKLELAKMNGVRDRFQHLIDFKHFMKLHNEENIRAWLNSIHISVGCNPAFIGGHTVDGTKTFGISVE